MKYISELENKRNKQDFGSRLPPPEEMGRVTHVWTNDLVWTNNNYYYNSSCRRIGRIIRDPTSVQQVGGVEIP